MIRYRAGKDAGRGAHAGILVHEQDGPEKDPLQMARLMFDCTVQPFERKNLDWESGRELKRRTSGDSQSQSESRPRRCRRTTTNSATQE